MCLGTTGVVTRIRDDGGIPMALIAAPAGSGAAAGGTVSACLLTCPEAAVGDTVLVHSGYVLQILDPGPVLQEDP
ncbi:MAG TPA: HypC/HybG/HupF family hydrogenase formation chaperone [Trebonia sp.]|nr:HypC/HybG/HupF family hydrogenase formation chaperone [Trebonia sp.]